ncbi:hypothetical protein Goarm_011496 [Gossypium armourianum]|uniref:Uncharacterized protein n=1 Tax=Gossypium armourianum TaxID=34283 RepID=A0A7J9IX17_9ROSI|nr:hypothetical protein [Gossypium armourianum]
MRKIRGFKIGKRLVRISRWFIRKARHPRGYCRLTQSESKSFFTFLLVKTQSTRSLRKFRKDTWPSISAKKTAITIEFWCRLFILTTLCLASY